MVSCTFAPLANLHGAGVGFVGGSSLVARMPVCLDSVFASYRSASTDRWKFGPCHAATEVAVFEVRKRHKGSPRRNSARRLLFEMMEPRIVLSATLGSAVAPSVSAARISGWLLAQENASVPVASVPIAFAATLDDTKGDAIAPLPSSYDLGSLGYLTPVRHQGNCGACWTFSTMAALESSILMAGGPQRDLSENDLKNHHGFERNPCEGGNPYQSQAYFSRWSGPVDEADDPYHPYDDRPSPGGDAQYYVRQSWVFDTDAEIKNGLMTYGALASNMYWTDDAYRSADQTYYTAEDQPGNHGITIVGWDDNRQTTAPTDGAWLIKNSWGTRFGDAGYFWIAYDDVSSVKTGISFHDAVGTSNYNNVYHHDEFGVVARFSVAYAMNAFTPTETEDLTAVSFFAPTDNSGYEIRIYDTFNGSRLSGLLTTVHGTSEYTGFQTVDLPTSLSLRAGDSFYVYLHITNGGEYPQAIDKQMADYTASQAAPGESFYSQQGYTWTDLTTFDETANFAIKALTSKTSVVARHVFYNDSKWDGNSRAANAADDKAIATDKQALLPGAHATFANYTSYSRGMNGVMIDVAVLAGMPNMADFTFRVGTTGDPTAWATAPMPTSLRVRAGEGVDGSDRVTIVWANGAIEDAWLQVTMKATSRTGLDAPDVFYFGNAIGETGNASSDTKVSAYDMLGTRNNPRSLHDPAPIDFAYDFNRDMRVDAADMLIARDHPTHFLNDLVLLQAPGAKAAQIAIAASETATSELATMVLAATKGDADGSPQPAALLREQDVQEGIIATLAVARAGQRPTALEATPSSRLAWLCAWEQVEARRRHSWSSSEKLPIATAMMGIPTDVGE